MKLNKDCHHCCCQRIGGSLESIYGPFPHWKLEWDIITNGEHRVIERLSATSAESAIKKIKLFWAPEKLCHNYKVTQL